MFPFSTYEVDMASSNENTDENPVDTISINYLTHNFIILVNLLAKAKQDILRVLNFSHVEFCTSSTHKFTIQQRYN